MSLNQLETREFFALGLLLFIAIIIIAIKAFQFMQEQTFQHDLNTLQLNDFVNKYQHEIPKIELTLLWKRQQSLKEEEANDNYQPLL